MNRICEKNSCTGCGACSQICPKKSVKLSEDAEGFLHPVIDSKTCIDCGLCQKVCPVNNAPVKRTSEFYMCWNRDRGVLEKSSSGGAFSAIAKCVFDQNGVVFGACQDFDPNIVYHTKVESYEDLDRIRLSKYSQSDTRDTYKQIRDLLMKGIPVLFCGTACQVGGLLNYISCSGAASKLSLLYTVDVLCHGVASQKTVNAFLESKEKAAGKKIVQYYFRVKTEKEGWRSGAGTRMKLVFDDGSVKISPVGTDTFFLGFNNNIFLRESCYECRYCGQERVSDFTIADYWGVTEDSVSASQLHQGVSVMTVNTEKGFSMLPMLEQLMEIEKIEPDIAVANNGSFRKPNARPALRSQFFNSLQTSDYDAVINKLLWKQVAKSRIKAVIGQDTVKKIKSIVKRGK